VISSQIACLFMVSLPRKACGNGSPGGYCHSEIKTSATSRDRSRPSDGVPLGQGIVTGVRKPVGPVQGAARISQSGAPGAPRAHQSGRCSPNHIPFLDFKRRSKPISWPPSGRASTPLRLLRPGVHALGPVVAGRGAAAGCGLVGWGSVSRRMSGRRRPTQGGAASGISISGRLAWIGCASPSPGHDGLVGNRVSRRL
jgi:hypothetical protein